MTLNQLIKNATAISHKYTTGDIPLMIYGTEVDIVLTEQGENGNHYIEVNYIPTPKEKPREIIRQAVISVEDMFLKDLPPCVSLLPNDWNGEATRVKMTFSVSRQAVNNEKFDVQGFIKAKFDNTLKAIRHRRGIDELRLTRRISMTIDPMSGREKVQIYIHIEYANE